MKKILFTLLISSFISCTCVEKDVTVTILSHNTSTDKYGEITYNTIVKYGDGSLINKKGMSFYVLPIGETCIIKETDCSMN